MPYMTDDKDCPYNSCDGTGFFIDGEFDDFRLEKCLCLIDKDLERDEEITNNRKHT